MTEHPLKADDGSELIAFEWSAAQGKPRALIQIAHGMGEHIGRYQGLIDTLVATGYAVYANNHRGHGPRAAQAGHLGSFGAGGFAALVADMAAVSRFAKQRHPGSPLILIGHSMGSFAAQCYLPLHGGLLAGAVLSGTTCVDMLAAAGAAGWKLEDINNGFANPRTAFDWLSRDTAIVDAYIADPLCGFTVDEPAFGSMIVESMQATTPQALAKIRGDLPLCALVGDQDPVNHGLEWFTPLMARYRGAGMTRVSSHVYGGARHEVFNETNRAEVIANLLAWIEHVVLA
jgi:alpha-beta hydrolase superfamily lysophospholipase